MAKVWPTGPTPPEDLPHCEHPGCGEPAPYGYGCTLRSRGRHFCKAHRPDESVVIACDEPPAPTFGDLFAASRRSVA